MESFFDLRELLIALLRRLKMIILITFVFTIGWAMVRFVPLAIQYFTYDARVDEALNSQFLSKESQPYQYQARRTLYIPPILTLLGETYRDEATVIVNAYNTLKSNREVLQPLVDEFFAEAQRDDANLKQKMVDCNYRTRLVFNEEYKLTNFYSQLAVDVADHMVNIYFTSGEAEFSNLVVERAEQLLSAYVAKTIKPFSYKITEGQTGFWLPQPTDGLIPKTGDSLTLQAATGSKPETSHMIKQGIRGGIIGCAAGLGLSVILIFFFQVTKSTIQTGAEAKELGARVLTVVRLRKKSRLLPFIDRWIEYIEGNETAVSSTDESARIILEKISLEYPQDKKSILLTGSQPQKTWEPYAQAIMKKSEGSNIEVSISPCIMANADTIRQSRSANGIVLIEQFDKSSVSDIKRELDEFAELNRPVLGVILID